ncbi:hypothetical protein V9T40_007401 [Parthenolecanium corni]|uniref:Uncharacterized protein n=1 Tax=Parthenolecanium corni TaxID=536013 RepID=A0AAN9U4Z1_9HEMI
MFVESERIICTKVCSRRQFGQLYRAESLPSSLFDSISSFLNFDGDIVAAGSGRATMPNALLEHRIPIYASTPSTYRTSTYPVRAMCFMPACPLSFTLAGWWLTIFVIAMAQRPCGIAHRTSHRGEGDCTTASSSSSSSTQPRGSSRFSWRAYAMPSRRR